MQPCLALPSRATRQCSMRDLLRHRVSPSARGLSSPMHPFLHVQRPSARPRALSPGAFSGMPSLLQFNESQHFAGCPRCSLALPPFLRVPLERKCECACLCDSNTPPPTTPSVPATASERVRWIAKSRHHTACLGLQRSCRNHARKHLPLLSSGPAVAAVLRPLHHRHRAQRSSEPRGLNRATEARAHPLRLCKQRAGKRAEGGIGPALVRLCVLPGTGQIGRAHV